MITWLVQFFAGPCPGGTFLGFPRWHKYLNGVNDPKSGLCSPQLQSINDVWLVLAALLEVLLRVAVLLAVAYVIYGGVQFITSQGEPARTTQARHTIVNALIGLVMAVIATTAVAFVAGRFN